MSGRFPQLVERSHVKEFLDSFDTVLTDCDGFMTQRVSIMDDHELYMAEFADEILSRSSNSKMLSEDKFLAIISHLRNPQEKVSPKFKWWVKTKCFRLLDLPKHGLKDVLVIPKKGATVSRSSRSYLKVVNTCKLYHIIHKLHSQSIPHTGYKNIMREASKEYYGIARSYVQQYCKTCPTCQRVGPTPVKHGTSKKFLDRYQINLISMIHCPDGSYNHIGHVTDHITKLHVLFPLKTITTDEVSTMIEERVLAYLGPLHMFLSDVGRKILNLHTIDYFTHWPGDDGEKNSQLIEDELTKMKAKSSSDDFPWASWLPRIMFNLNTAVHSHKREQCL